MSYANFPNFPDEEKWKTSHLSSSHSDISETIEYSGGNVALDLFAAVWRHALALSIWILICLSAGAAHVALAPAEFLASAQIALEPRIRLPSGSDAVAAASATLPMLDSAQAESQALIISSERNLRYVFEILKLDKDPVYTGKAGGRFAYNFQFWRDLFFSQKPPNPSDETTSRSREAAFQNFAGRVKVKRLGQSYVLDVSFRGSDPADTARITNSIASAYIRDQVLVHAQAEQRGGEFLQGRISQIQTEKIAADKAVATGVVTDLQFPDSDARIVGSALTPLVASYPQTKLILFFCAVFGIVTGVAFVIIQQNFDDKIRSTDQIRRAFRVGFVIRVPRHNSKSLTNTTVLSEPEAEFSQSMRLLRASIFASRDGSHRLSMGFVGCEAQQGCSTLSANLSQLLAFSGFELTLIDGNISDPSLTRTIEGQSHLGLSNFAPGKGFSFDLPQITVSDNLNFVPAVATIDCNQPNDPNKLLGTEFIRSGLTKIKSQRHVVIDLPPLCSSSDAQSVGSLLTGVVLIATLNHTSLRQLYSAIQLLRDAGTHVLGIVLNDPPQRNKIKKERILNFR